MVLVQLSLDEFGVSSRALQQRRVRACVSGNSSAQQQAATKCTSFDDFAAFNNEYLVGVDNGGQAVRNHQHLQDAALQ